MNLVDFKKKKSIVLTVFYAMMFGSILNGFNLIKQQNNWNYACNYYYTLTYEQALLKNNVTQYKDLVNKSKIELNNAKDKFNFIMPQKLDVSSMLIFLEEYALLNDVTVTKIDLHNANGNGSFTSFGITYKPISVEIIGNYNSIIHFLSDIQNNMGIVNFIDNVTFKGASGDSIKWNEKNNSNDEEVTVNFELYIGFNGREGGIIEQ